MAAAAEDRAYEHKTVGDRPISPYLDVASMLCDEMIMP